MKHVILRKKIKRGKDILPPFTPLEYYIGMKNNKVYVKIPGYDNLYTSVKDSDIFEFIKK